MTFLNKKNSLFFFKSLFFLLIILFLATRLFHLTSNFLWQDESFIIRWGQIIRYDPSQLFIPLEIGYPPFFPWFNSIIFLFIQDPLLSGRMTSVIGGLISAISLYFISIILFKKKEIGLCTMFVFIFFPYAFFINRFAVTDNLVVAFGLLSLLFLLLLVVFKKFYYVIPLSFSIAFSMMAKTTGILYLYLLPLIFFLKESRKIRVLLWIICCIIFANLIYSLLKISPNYERILWLNGGVSYTKKEFISLPFLAIIQHLITSTKYASSFVFEFFPFSYALLVIYGVIFLRDKKVFYLLLFSFISFVAIALFSRSTMLAVRHLYLTTVTLLPIIGYAFYEIAQKIGKIKSLFKYVLLTVFAIFIFYAPFKFIGDAYFQPEKLNLKNTEFENYFDFCGSQTGMPESIEYFRKMSSKSIYIETIGLHGLATQGLSLYLWDNPKIVIHPGDFDYSQALKKTKFPNDIRPKFLAGFFPINFRQDSEKNYQLILESTDKRKTCNFRVYKKI